MNYLFTQMSLSLIFLSRPDSQKYLILNITSILRDA